MPIVVPDYKAPSWCPGGHLQTVIPAKFMPRPAIEYRREKVELPDGDFMLWDWAVPEPVAIGDVLADLMPTIHPDVPACPCPYCDMDAPATEWGNDQGEGVASCPGSAATCSPGSALATPVTPRLRPCPTV